VSRDRWLTPDSTAGFFCRRLLIPAGPDWLAIVTGALNELIYTYNFEKFGDQTPEDTVAAFQVMFDQFCLDDDQECRMIGEIVTFASDTSPNTNWLSCDGASLLRADYPDLFAVIGTTFGAVDGTHFSLPDLQGRVPIGDGAGSGLTPRVLGDSFGEEDHQLNVAELAAPSHSDTPVLLIGTQVPPPFDGYGPSIFPSSTGSTGGDAPHNNMQPSLALHYFIVAT